MPKYIHNKTQYNIEFDGSSLAPIPELSTSRQTEFESGIKAILDAIVGRMVGQQVFSNLPKGKTVRIVPRTTPSGVFTPDVCNALAEPPPMVAGDGKPAVISIDPLTWKPKGDCNTAGSAGTAVDEVLLHEILHSYRQLSGHQRSDAFNVPPDKQYGTIEEFWAIVVTNVYMSEGGKTLLRQDHESFAALPPKWSTSMGFLSDRDLLRWSRTILDQEKALLGAIDTSISASTRFNPFHELLKNPGKFPIQIDIDPTPGPTQRP